MVQHIWGDDFDWAGLDEAGHYIYRICKTYGRFPCTWKEKYGTLRLEPYFTSTIDYDYPNRWPMWWKKYIYRRAYYNAVKKWPHLKAEILQDAYEEYLPRYRDYINSMWKKCND